MKNKVRADQLVAELPGVESRSKAQALILAGSVEFKTADGWQKIKKAGDALAPGTEFRIDDATLADVSRGAQKLRGAFAEWPQLAAAARGALALDIGSSTGGFTQVLLEHGATRVVALDVGTHQLHERLRRDPRVLSLEQTHVLKITREFWQSHAIGEFDLFVTDVSFISVKKVLAHAQPWLRRDGYWVVLVKPQFELDAKKVPKGVVKNPEHRKEALDGVISLANETGCFRVIGYRESPLTGADGNVEYLLCLQKF